MSSDGLLTAPGLTNRAKKEDSDGPGAPLLAGNGAAIESVVAASGTGWREVDATTVQEVCLLWALAWPLFFQTLLLSCNSLLFLQSLLLCCNPLLL